MTLARTNDVVSPELERARRERAPLLMNYLAAAMVVVILFLMVFKPGS